MDQFVWYQQLLQETTLYLKAPLPAEQQPDRAAALQAVPVLAQPTSQLTTSHLTSSHLPTSSLMNWERYARYSADLTLDRFQSWSGPALSCLSCSVIGVRY